MTWRVLRVTRASTTRAKVGVEEKDGMRCRFGNKYSKNKVWNEIRNVIFANLWYDCF